MPPSSNQVRDSRDAWRYERKFVTSGFDRAGVEALIVLHPAMFSELFPERFVNNIYFDSISREAYGANLAGVRRRLKFRIRWYGDLFGRVEKPVFEVKKKNGLVGTKDSFPLPPFDLDEELRPTDLLEVLLRSDVPDWLRCRCLDLEPALLNRYRRKYFRSVDRSYRITVDTDLRFYRIDRTANRFRESTVEERKVVIELKYDREDEKGAHRIASHFPFRLARISKYVEGVGRLNAD